MLIIKFWLIIIFSQYTKRDLKEESIPSFASSLYFLPQLEIILIICSIFAKSPTIRLTGLGQILTRVGVADT